MMRGSNGIEDVDDIFMDVGDPDPIESGERMFRIDPLMHIYSRIVYRSCQCRRAKKEWLELLTSFFYVTTYKYKAGAVYTYARNDQQSVGCTLLCVLPRI